MTHTAAYVLTDEQTAKLEGRFLSTSGALECTTVLKPDGPPLFKLSRNVIPQELCKEARSILKDAPEKAIRVATARRQSRLVLVMRTPAKAMWAS